MSRKRVATHTHRVSYLAQRLPLSPGEAGFASSTVASGRCKGLARGGNASCRILPGVPRDNDTIHAAEKACVTMYARPTHGTMEEDSRRLPLGAIGERLGFLNSKKELGFEEAGRVMATYGSDGVFSNGNKTPS